MTFRNDEDEYEASSVYRQLLVQFRDQVMGLQANSRYDGRNCTLLGSASTPYKWSFMGALFFSCTVFTTVGMLDHQGRIWDNWNGEDRAGKRRRGGRRRQLRVGEDSRGQERIVEGRR